ncbi:hypothetical protein GQF03_12315 [Sneathiella chungangensis]|uniref:Uncharacterized protein n=1 Tax=Sneathiella chungangensis TaxID=1418234 RepID=A0A845MHK0_9PROT|nr:hypothetical protein [Sneathiella chungangensis]MZR23112.1 hypothetical protein [Sneathiella chungangensis]
MNVDLIGKPAYLTDIRYGDLFYMQIGERIYPCIKTYFVKNDTEIIDYVVAFTPSERDRTYLPRLMEERNLAAKVAYRVSEPVFRSMINESSILTDIEYWPTPGIVIESSDATYLTIKSGRMPHKLMYLNISTGELIATSPKAPFVFVMEWKIVLQQEGSEQTLVRFPVGSPTLLKNAAAQ